MQPRAGEVGLTWINVRLVPMSPRLTWERKVCTEGLSGERLFLVLLHWNRRDVRMLSDLVW